MKLISRVIFVVLAALISGNAGRAISAEEKAGDEQASIKEVAAAAQNWPQWRGPLGRGVAPEGDPPIEWSEKKNILWRAPLPGVGHSTPVVWGDRVFLTAAIPYGKALPPKKETAPGAHDNSSVTHRHQFVALAIDRNDGRIVWQKTLRKVLPHEGGHNTGSLASNSPATDGERLFAFFGSRGLYALDFEGNLLWKVDFGEMQSKHAHGEGSSPALHGDTLVVNWDHEGDSFVAAFDTRTGKQRWRQARNEVTSWASPIIVERPGKTDVKDADGASPAVTAPLVIVSGTERIRAYDLATGKVIWECGGMAANIVASPVAGDGMLFAASSYVKRALIAIRLDGARGDITDSNKIAWSRRRGTPYVPSPLLYDGGLYFLSHYQGVLTRVRAATGEEPTGPFRLGAMRNIYASPVAAAGRIYVTDREGVTMVLSSGEIPRVLSVNKLDDRFSASAAIAGNQLFLRGEKRLYCIETE